MNLDSLSFALSQISNLVTNLTKKNYKSNSQEISNLVSIHGAEAERHLFRCLFSELDFSGDGKSSGKDFHQTQFLIQECTQLLKKPNFVSVLCYAVDNPLQQQNSLKPSVQLLTQLSATLKLNPFQEIAFGFAFLLSNSAYIRSYAEQFLSKKIPEVIKLVLATKKDSRSKELKKIFSDTPLQVFQEIVKYIFGDTKPTEYTSGEAKEFFSVLKRELRDQDFCIIRPLLEAGNLDIAEEISEEFFMMAKTSNNSIPEMVSELGYGFCASVEDCKNHLLTIGASELTPLTVAQIIGLMVQTHSNLSDPLNLQAMGSSSNVWNDNKEKDSSMLTTWNMNFLVEALEEVVPSMDWKEIIQELDHAGFAIKDRQGLKILKHTLHVGLKNEEFPIQHLLKPWRNVEGQLSLIQLSLKHADVFSFADYSSRAVALEMLKAPPEDDNNEITVWKSLDLVETLLYLSDVGQYVPVRKIFQYPIQHCPDVLIMNLLQINAQMNHMRQELLSNLIPIFLSNHPNSASILQYAWHNVSNASAVRNIVMRAMPEWYVRGENDQSRLSRILDVAQDLKALSALLNGNHLPFVIDLACLASRREYLKLDKWLTDKIREHGDQFIQACVVFLKRRCPQIIGGLVKDDNIPKNAQLPPETLATMLNCLQARAGNVSQELSEAILTMVANCNILLNKPRQPPPGVVKTPRGLEPAFSSSSLIPNVPPSSTPLDPLVSGIGAGISGLNIGSGTTNRIGSVTNTVNSANSGVGNVFPLTGSLNAFANAPTSPAKIMFSGLNAPNSAPGSQSAFSSFLPPGNTVMPPQVQNQSATNDMANIFPESLSVSKEVEEEANKYFACIYSTPPTMSVDDLLEMFKRFKESPVQMEREIFTCMIRYLFEEYKFFPKYPDKDLQINAQLFGGIIDHNLVTYMALGWALRCTLDSLKRPLNSSMYKFGITALERCKNRLKEYPQYCQHLAGIPHFSEFPPNLIEAVEFGSRSQEPPSRPHTSAVSSTVSTANESSTMPPVAATQTSALPAGSVVSTKPIAAPTSTSGASMPTSAIGAKPSIANATNIDTLLGATEKDDKIKVPPEPIQDKIAFVVNNLSLANLPKKCEDIKGVLTETYWPWLAQYMVMNRISIEPNFHSLYSSFFDALKLIKLIDLVINETYRNIKVLLQSDKTHANFSDRSLLKNLGHWLGILTLGRDKPILQLDLDVKALLIEAYHNGNQELLYVVPFIAKVLDSCAKSRVFKPPNPWTIGIMRVLAELHAEPELKLNLKFEIEVLCKTLGIDLNGLQPGNTLKDPEKLAQIEPQLSQSSSHNKELALVQRIAVNSAPSAVHTRVQEEPHPQQFTAIQHFGSNPPTNPPANTGFSTPTSMFFNTNAPQSNIPASLGGGQIPPAQTPLPHFSFNDFNNSNLTCLTQYANINNNIVLFQQHPQLKQLVSQSVEKSVQDWIVQVVDRAIKISLTTAEQIVKKDFALDPDETKMRMAAHAMVRNLTSGMAMITCRDHLSMSISNNFRNLCIRALKVAPQKDILDQAVSVVTQENVEIACCFIQKTAVEKAIPEMDARLNSEYEARKQARIEGRRYCEPAVLTYQAERMPECIRLKVGGIGVGQMTIYDEFARNIPGFLPNTEPVPPQPVQSATVAAIQQGLHPTVASSSFLPKPIPVMPNPVSLPQPSDDMTQIYDKVISELGNCIRLLMATYPTSNAHLINLHNLHDGLVVARNSRDLGASVGLLQKVVEGLFDGLNSQLNDPDLAFRYRESHILVLKALQDPRAYGPQWTTRQVTKAVLELRDDIRYNVDAIDTLFRNHVVNVPQYDNYLAQLMENGMNYLATSFAVQLCQFYFSSDRTASVLNESDLYNTLEALNKLAAHSRQLPEGLNQLIDVIRTNNETGFQDRGPTSLMHSGISQAREFDDPPGLHEKTEYLLREWVNLFHSSSAGRDSTKAFSIFVNQMNQQGILKTDELITRFFRLSTEMCVDLCYRALNEANASPTLVRVKCFHTLDAFVRLIALLVKHSGETGNNATKINLLNKVLGIVAGVLMSDHDVHELDFQQLPYHRIFIVLFLDLNSPEQILDNINFSVLTAFCNTLHILRPSKLPGFAFAWLEIVSHRVLLGRMLHHTPQQKTSLQAWGMYAQLLIDLFKYLAPFLRNAELPKSISILYKGTLRVLLVLLHDFPEFLCDYHYGFCDVIPPNCIQMRNLILSAFPRNMRLPDPFTPNLKVDMLNDIGQEPKVVTNFTSMIQPPSFKKDLDSYIKTRSPVTFLSDLRSNLQNSNEPGQKYNIPLMNALVLYVGTQAISYIASKHSSPNNTTITHSSHMDIFQNLAVDLDTEGRYLFLNAIANQLRYPNCHTHYFSCTLLYLFAEANTEAIQEQITRVLLERLIVNRPHPWGLLITFIELIKNPNYHFWDHQFVHCAPEIKKLFDSVARSCMQQKQNQPVRELTESYNFTGGTI